MLMKNALKISGLCLAGGLLAGAGWMLHRQALNPVRDENRALRQQIEESVARIDALAAENARLAMLLGMNQTNASPPLTQEPSAELLRLRGEVGRLRVQEREMEQLRREQMTAAQSRLTNAEVELVRLSQLHSQKLVSEAELSEARFTVELLKAEAKGDTAQAAQVRLRQAEEELARAAKLHSQSLISQSEYDAAVRKVESARAGAQ